MPTPGNETQPPAIGRGAEHGSTERRILIIDVAYPGFAAVQHPLRLGKPVVARVNLIGYGQRIVGRQLRVALSGTGNDGGALLASGPDGREVVEAIDPGLGVPSENEAGPQ